MPKYIPKKIQSFFYVPGLDGMQISYQKENIYLTPDDLISVHAYDRAFTIFDQTMGLDFEVALALASTILKRSPNDLRSEATFFRVRFRAEKQQEKPILDRKKALVFVKEAAAYLIRGQSENGRFRYLVDLIENQTLPGYNWARHAGATFFLAQAARFCDDQSCQLAAAKAVDYMLNKAYVYCGKHPCIASESDDIASLGASALAVVALSEMAHYSVQYKEVIESLVAYLKSQQREDGEFDHEYDRRSQKKIAKVLPYYTGEAALALSKAHKITGNQDELEAAKKALDYSVHDAWNFFGSQYYVAEEHWTCQAMSDLWDRSPSEQALKFCLNWNEVQRNMQYRDPVIRPGAEGAYGFTSWVTPRFAPLSSRSEASGATLSALKRWRPSPVTAYLLEEQFQSGLSLLLRAQIGEKDRGLVLDYEAVRGAVPASYVDYRAQIDYVQHAGSAMIRYLEIK